MALRARILGARQRPLISFFALALALFLLWQVSKADLHDSPPLILPGEYLQLLQQRGLTFDTNQYLCSRILADFGAVFAVGGGVVRPSAYMFRNETAVSEWQSSTPRDSALITYDVVLQSRALAELKTVREEARKMGLDIQPASKDASRRSYAVTVDLWLSRVQPGISHWIAAGRLSKAEGERILSLIPDSQVVEILQLEQKGLYFSRDFQKSILFSVAAPGTSQHLSLLAFDVNEHANPEVRAILARHGWFQTVYSDLPHFTFLGRPESELPSLGLVLKSNVGRSFWVVNAAYLPGTRLFVGGKKAEADVTDTCPF